MTGEIRNPDRRTAEEIFEQEDFFKCEECNTIADAYKYDKLRDTGHEGHKIRALTPAETIEAMADCLENECLEEE